MTIRHLSALFVIALALSCSAQNPSTDGPVAEAQERLTSNTVAGFDPAVYGFAFSNDFQNYDSLPAGMDFRSGGLCGGMSYSVLDYYYSKIPIPPQWWRPAEGSTLQSYIFGRQTTSINSNLDRWAELMFNPFGARSSEFFNWGLQSSNGGALQQLIAKIDGGDPAELGLKGTNGTGDHQVIAYGYDMGAYQGDLGDHESDLKIYILDPNHPRTRQVLVPNVGGNYYYYLDHTDENWVTYFVDQNYHVNTPPVINDPPAYANDGLIHEIVFSAATGSDDMHGSDDLTLTMNLVDGTQETFPNINGGGQWISNYTQYVPIVLTTPQPESNIFSFVLSGSFDPDNWDMNSADITGVMGSSSGVDTRVELLLSPQGYHRFTGNSVTISMPVTEPPQLVSSLQMTFVTGDDNLGDWNDQLTVTVTMKDGSQSVTYDVNDGYFDNNSTNVRNVVLSKPVLPSQLSSLQMNINHCDGLDCDNWTMNSVSVRAQGNGIDEAVGSHGYYRFQGTTPPLVFPLTGVDAQCLEPISFPALPPPNATAPITYCGGPVQLTVPIATDPCTHSPVAVTGVVQQVTAPPPAALTTSLQLTFVTGDDNLDASKDQLTATLTLNDGTTVVANNVNGGTFDNGSTNVRTMALSTPVLLSDLSSLQLSITPCSGLFCDNWTMASVSVRAEGNGVDMPIGSYGANRFTGSANTLTFPLTPGVTTATSIPVNADGTVTVPIAQGSFQVQWTSASTTTSAAVSETQTVFLVNPAPTLTADTTDPSLDCAGSSGFLPPPQITTVCSAPKVTGQIVSVNGTVLATPIAIAANGTVASLPIGAVGVLWTGTDSSGASAQLAQTFNVTSNGPCLGGPGAGGLGGWTITGGTLSLPQGLPPAGGPALALQVTTPAAGGSSWNAIKSPPFSTVGLTTGANLQVDVYIPANANPYWLGDFQALISAPSANVYNDYLGQVQFMSPKLPVGGWLTVSIPLNAAAIAALSKPHNDVTIELDLNVTAGTGPWYIGNLRI